MLEECLQCLERRLDDSSKIVGKADRRKVARKPRGAWERKRRGACKHGFQDCIPVYQFLVHSMIGRSILTVYVNTYVNHVACRAQSQTNVAGVWNPPTTAHFDTTNSFPGSGLRHLKKCLQALPFSLTAVFRCSPPLFYPPALTEDMAQATFEFNFANEAQSFQTPQALFTSLMGSTSFPDFSMSFSTWRTNQGCLTVLQQSPQNIFLPKSDDTCLSFLWTLSGWEVRGYAPPEYFENICFKYLHLVHFGAVCSAPIRKL